MGPGSVIAGKYELTRPLGEGGMGAVWEARNLRTQRSFALKLVHGDADLLPELRERMLREASVAGRLEHPNVIEVYDVGETDAGDPFLVMELLRGETLAELLDRRGALDQIRAAAIGAEVSSALQAAHGAGVIHRDLKPANVFLHQDAARGRVVKVLDFGVSKLTGSESTSATVTGAPIGTPAYMSPEQARGKREIDGRTDLWAVGVMLFEMVAGRLPFAGETAYAVVGEVLHAAIPRLSSVVPSVSPELDAIVARCLDRDPARRFASATELRAALQTLLPKQPSALVADFDEDATVSRSAPKNLIPAEVSETATTAVVGPRAPVLAATPALARQRPAALWPLVGAGVVGSLFLLGLAGGMWFLREKPAGDPIVAIETSTTATQLGGAAPPSATAEPRPSAAPPPPPSVTPVEPAPSASAAPAAKRPVPRFYPCPKDKIILDAHGRKTCVRR
jgi:serine/threonine-protein kinase